MAVGASGRIVVEIQPKLKRELYAALSLEGITLKDWFLRQAGSFIATGNQLPLAFDPRARTRSKHSGRHE